jgi:tRNA (adenine22-N1)-methyltransferase
MKLSTRLTALCQTIPDNTYQHIWDCCCDHGYLGQQLMTEHPQSKIHFVDVIPHLIEEVKKRLINVPDGNWLTHYEDAAKITLETAQNNLVIIAGVGGDLLMEMVEAIYTRHASLFDNNRLDFLLCPVRQLHKVREGLNQLNLGLISEKIIQDNHQFYEVIQVSNQSNKPVSMVGSEMWDLSNKEHVAYRDTMIQHYEKQPNAQAKILLKQYKGIT